MTLFRQLFQCSKNQLLNPENSKSEFRFSKRIAAYFYSTKLATILMFLWLNSVTGAAQENVFTDDQWATAFSASMPISHQHGIEDIAVDKQGNIYLGGDFNVVGSVIANNVVKWDGESWHPLGTGIDGKVIDLTFMGDELYAVREGVNDILKWDGQSWSPVGETFNGAVVALASSGTKLYASGTFTSVGNNTAKHIAQWDGSSWKPVGDGIDGQVDALSVVDGKIYVAMGLNPAPGLYTSNIIRWDGSEWSELGEAVRGWVNVITGSNEEIFIGGIFSKIGEQPFSNIARWHGNNWSDVSEGTGGKLPYYSQVNAILVSGSDLFVGGRFDTAGGLKASRIARWDRESWYPLDQGIDLENWGMVGYGQAVNALAYSERDGLIVAGQFKSIGGIHVANVARWDGDSWSPLGTNGSGITASRGNGPSNAQVNALEVVGDSLFLGGNFTINHTAHNIAQWEGMNHGTPLGSGVNGPVNALEQAGKNLYAGGWFSKAGDVEANCIAKWDGDAWSPLGTGTNGEIFAIASSGSDVYVGGYFTTAGGVEASNIAKWDGDSWEPLGAGLFKQKNQNGFGGSVHAIAVVDDVLYAAGYFSRSGNVKVCNIAKWDGDSWSALGPGTNGGVHALALAGNDLYVGGDFSSTGNIKTKGIAKWDGERWAALSSGLESNGRKEVKALAVFNDELYVGGVFDQAGEIAASNITKWDGITWSNLGSGIEAFWDQGVNALAITGSELFAGGEFSIAGGKAAGSLARAFLREVPHIEIDDHRHTVFFRDITSGAYRIERSADLQTWESFGVRYAWKTGGIDFTDEPSHHKGFYRAIPVKH